MLDVANSKWMMLTRRQDNDVVVVGGDAALLFIPLWMHDQQMSKGVFWVRRYKARAGVRMSPLTCR